MLNLELINPDESVCNEFYENTWLKTINNFLLSY